MLRYTSNSVLFVHISLPVAQSRVRYPDVYRLSFYRITVFVRQECTSMGHLVPRCWEESVQALWLAYITWMHADQLLQCHQLLSALSWMSNQGTSCGHMPDLQRLRTATEARSNALQDAALEDHCTLTRVQQALPADSNGVAVYPFPSLMGCLTSVFLSDPYGTEVDASRTDARARLVLYYFWDSGSQCDWRVCSL